MRNMIKVIERKDIPRTIEFLAEGFPKTSPAFWKAGLANIQAFDCHKNGDCPIGHAMYSNGEMIGIGLTPTRLNTCPATNKIAKTVNFSAWYVVDKHRWKLPMLLRAMMADEEAVYTDLTPAPEVEIILKKMGFSALNDGVSAVPTALYSFIGGRRHKVMVWDPAADCGFSDERVKLLKDHQDFGCFIYMIEHEGRSLPLILKISKVKGFRAAQIIFSENRDVLKGALGGLCAELTSVGCSVLFIDFPAEGNSNNKVAGLRFKQKFRRLAKNATPSNITDYTYSELVSFNG